MTKTKTANETKTCQICGRGIKAVAGVIAHHGYQRPGTGWQSASCEGARELPFEVSCDVLKAHVARVAESVEQQAEALRRPVTSLLVLVERKRTGRYNGKSAIYDEQLAQVTADTFAAVLAAHPDMGELHGISRYAYDKVALTWQLLVDRNVAARTAQLENTRIYHAHQSARLAAWVAPKA